jgi:hypothetical protein
VFLYICITEAAVVVLCAVEENQRKPRKLWFFAVDRTVDKGPIEREFFHTLHSFHTTRNPSTIPFHKMWIILAGFPAASRPAWRRQDILFLISSRTAIKELSASFISSIRLQALIAVVMVVAVKKRADALVGDSEHIVQRYKAT